MRSEFTRGEVLPRHGLGWVGVGVRSMGLMGGTIVLVVRAVQQLPVRALLQVLRKGDVIHGAVRAHSSLCTAAYFAEHGPTWADIQHSSGLGMTWRQGRALFCSYARGVSSWEAPSLKQYRHSSICMAAHQPRSC